MNDFIDAIEIDVPDDMAGESVTPATEEIFQTMWIQDLSAP